MPNPQLRQEVEPETELYVPKAQFEQTEAPAKLINVPVLQGVQNEARAELYEPALHAVQRFVFEFA